MSDKDYTLEQKVGALEADVQNLNRTMSRLTDVVQGLADKISNSQRTDWSVLGAWATVIIGVLGGLGYLTTRPMEYDLRILENKFYHHENAEGHAELVIRMNAIEKRVDEIREEQINRTRNVYKSN